MARRQNQFRIIGGQWRGRKLSFPDGKGLRPTPDRVRETVFNWLMPVMQGARCLDLFTGSGAMGLEALSRGAAQVVMLDSNRDAIRQLGTNLQILQADQAGQAGLKHVDASAYLHTTALPFDVVFLDPPYNSDLLAQSIQLLEERGWLKDKSYIYIECASESGLPDLPANWDLQRSKTAGQVAYHLAVRYNNE